MREQKLFFVPSFNMYFSITIRKSSFWIFLLLLPYLQFFVFFNCFISFLFFFSSWMISFSSFSFRLFFADLFVNYPFLYRKGLLASSTAVIVTPVWQFSHNVNKRIRLASPSPTIYVLLKLITAEILLS